MPETPAGPPAGNRDSDPFQHPAQAERAPRVLLRFGIASFLAMALATAAVVWFVNRELIDRGKVEVSEKTEFVSRTVVAGHLRASDLKKPLAGSRLKQIDAVFKSHVLDDEILRVKVYSPVGTVIYSNDHSLIGTTSDDPDEIAEVLGGATARSISTINKEGGTGKNIKVLESYAPIRLEGHDQPLGVFEIYNDYGEIVAATKNTIAPIGMILIVAMLSLYIALLPLLRRTTTSLKHSNRKLTRQATRLTSALEERDRFQFELRRTIADLRESERRLSSSHEETIMRLSMAAEQRDAETGEHILRMGRYCTLIAEKLDVDPAQRELIRLASPLHDVGKIATPDAILRKPGTLTPTERLEMQRHAEIGHEMLSGSESELLDLGATIALTHHEHWDGTGYPRGLTGSEIPLEGRIAAIADVFDALTSDRVYRPAMPIEKALSIMKDGRGTHFDPHLLDIFVGAIDEVLEIREDYSDAATSQPRHPKVSQLRPRRPAAAPPNTARHHW